MREIKFRVWDKIKNEWYEPTYRADEGDLEYLKVGLNGRLSMIKMVNRQVEIHDVSLFPDRFELIQYTGLKDKNSVEIYEGDIVSCRQYDNSKIYFEDGTFKIKYQKNERNKIICNLYHFLEKNKSTKVIGNIYENPKLIKEKEDER